MNARILTAALLALTPVAAEAGTRATYSGDPGHALIVEVADNGEVRIGEENAPDYGILRDGAFYIVGSYGGQQQVARMGDVADAIDTVVTPPIFAGILTRPPEPAPLTVTKGGPVRIAGRAGTAYTVAGLNPAAPAQTAAYVMSTDADLKPVGAALEAFMNAALLPGAAITGPGTAALIAQTRAIFALGTPLDAGGRLRLEKVETLPIPPTRTQLPAPPARVEELIAAMRAGRG